MPSSILREGSKGAGKAEDFIGSDITALRICFRANSDIRITASGTTRTEGLVLKDVDRINGLLSTLCAGGRPSFLQK